VIVDKKLGALFKCLSKETDRGIVIVVGTVIEERLARLLKEVLIHRRESDDFISRNLCGLEARAKAAYCIGAISRREFEMIDFVRRIRNDFAHQFITDSFDGSLQAKKAKVFDALTKFLPGYNLKTMQTTREAFETLAVHLITTIWEREHEFEESDYIEERE